MFHAFFVPTVTMLSRRVGSCVTRVSRMMSSSSKETMARHRPVMNVTDKYPLIANETFVAPNASVIGSVLIFGKVSVWYGAVIRGDKNIVRIGTHSSIADRAVLSTVSTLPSGFPAELDVGRECTVGAGALLTSCTIKDGSTIGAGAVIGEGAVVGENCHIAAGAVVPAHTLVPDNQLWAGNPAVYVRDVSGYEIDEREDRLDDIWMLATKHSEEFSPYGTVYQGAADA